MKRVCLVCFVVLVLLAAGVGVAQNTSAAAAAPADPPEWITETSGVFSGKTERPLRYWPDGTDFVITNGTEFFNRPLYCLNSPFRVDGGDKPEFSLYVPGRGGNLRFGIKTAAGAKWLHDADTIVARYRPGSLLYEIQDSLLGKGELRLVVLPLSETKGLVARAELRGGESPVELIWAFGGANGMRGRRGGDIGCEREPVSQFFQLRPEQCKGNEFFVATNTFVLRSKPATIAGVASVGARLAVADASKWASVDELVASGGQTTELPVVVGQAIMQSDRPLYFALQQTGGSPGATGAAPPAIYRAEDLPGVFAAAEEHRRAIAARVVVETPDPFINAAAAALNIAADGIWDERQQSFMHGAVAWRSRLLGWRGPYTGDALGWHDRTAAHIAGFAKQQNTSPIPESIPPADADSNLARNETALHSNGDLTKSHYDMNLVAVDVFFRHLLWTGDLDYARRLWPVIERHLAWERRLFRREFGPEKLPLYEAYAAIWASDDMDYSGGGATHATAYNHFHNRMAARVARLLRYDATPYEREADLIWGAMRKYLWVNDGGWFAEFKDYLGLQLVHPNAGLWTFYHTVDSEVPTPIEAWQMTRFVDTQIAHIPIHGPGVPEGNYFTLPTTSWMPYTWSLNNVVMAEAAHTSLAYWQANRPEVAFRLFKGCLFDSMFMGQCPGNLGMTTYFDMARREAQRDFADAVGVCSRTLVEGLFGVQPDVLAGELRIRPGLPADWNHASLHHPDFDFTFRGDAATETFSVASRFPKPMALRLQVPALCDSIIEVAVNGREAQWHALEDSVGLPRVEILCPPAAQHQVVIHWKGDRPATASAPAIVAKDGAIRAEFGAAAVHQVADPQGALSKVVLETNSFRAVAGGAMGQRTVFARLGQGGLTWWQPVTFETRPALEILQSDSQDAGHLRFRVRNNTPETIDREAAIYVGKTDRSRLPPFVKLRLPPWGESDEIAVTAERCLPGSNPLVIELLGEGRTIKGVVTNWKLRAMPTARLETINLTQVLNDKVTQIFRNEYLSPRSPFCSLAIPKQGIGSWCNFRETFDVDDSGLRAAAAKAGGRFVLPNGVPFQSPAEAGATNIAFTSQWDNYPREVTVPLTGRASHAYLLMAGSANPMQSRFDDGEVIVAYTDGTTERLALRNPTSWWPLDQDYFIDDFAFRRPEPIPPRVDLKTGNVRVLDVDSFKGRGGKVPGGCATVLDVPLNAEKKLESLTVRTLANEVVIGLMAVTLAR